MSRKKKFILNSCSGLFKQLITFICGFVMTKAILSYYGSSLNGLVASITQFLGFIGFLELGIGPVIQSNLYKPLAEKDEDQISRIVKASNRFFNTIGCIFIGYIIVLCVIFPVYINSDYDYMFTASLILIISISTIAQYFFGMTYELLLNADQKGYIQVTIQWITLLINTVLCIILMKLGVSIRGVKLLTTLIYVVRPILLLIYVKKHYKIDRRIKLEEEPIKQKWNGFAQHIAAVICDNTDVAVLTIFSSLSNVSIYTVYYSVVYGVTQIIMTAVNGLEAMWGNMIANKEWDVLSKSFSFTEWIIHNIVLFVFTVTGLLITPFIMVYTNGINDANYYQPLFGGLLVLAYAIQCLRIPYFRVIKAAGHYRQTQNGAFISTGLNIVVSIAMVSKFGLMGVAVGTIVALLFHTLYFVNYLRTNILKRTMKYFWKSILSDLVIVVLSYMVSNIVPLKATTYLEWILLAIVISVIVLLVSIGTNCLMNMNNMRKAYYSIINKLRRS